MQKIVAEVLPPAEKCPSGSLLQSIAVQLETEIALFDKLEQEASIRALRIGMLLLHAQGELKRGEFEPWLEEHAQEFGRRHAFRFMKLAKIFMEKNQIQSPAAKQLCAATHSEKGFSGKLVQQFFAFIEGKTLNDLFDEYGIKSRTRKTPGGDNVLIAWLRANGHADLVGTPRNRLPADIQKAFNDFEIKRHLKQHAEDRPARIRREYEQLRDALSSAILVKKSYSHLYKKELELLYHMLTECRSEIAGALKMPDEEFRDKRISMIKAAAEKAEAIIS